jgi:hypothetical protein
MNIQSWLAWAAQHKGLIVIHLIAFDHIISQGFQAIGWTKWVSVLETIATFLGAVITATKQVIAANKKTAAIIIVGGLLMPWVIAPSAHADIFQPIPHRAETKQFLADVNGLSTNADTLLTDAAAIINYLGVREGYAYQFNQHKWVTTTGATIVSYTPWNVALGVTMLNTDGVVADIDWNIGNYLPVQDVPIMNLTQYLYIFGGAGAQLKTEDDGSQPMKFASVGGIEAKFSF